MPHDHDRDVRAALVGALLALAGYAAAPLLLGCDASTTALLLGGASEGDPDGGATRDLDGSVIDEPDGSKNAPIEVRGSGFDAYAGRTIYGKIGPLSSVVVSTTIEPDGTFVLSFPRVLVILGNAYLGTFVDIDGDGECQSSTDEVRGTPIHLEETAGGYRVDVAASDLEPALLGCSSLNL
jgi:hypothetical protein